MSAKKQANRSLDNYQCFMQEFLSNHICLPDILINEYQQLKLTDTELVHLIRIVKHSKDWSKFTFDIIMDEFDADSSSALAIIQPLIEKGLICDVDGPESGIYSFDGLFKELSEIWFYCKSSQKKTKPLLKAAEKKRKDNVLGRLYQAFEKEFGRGLSPMENDKLTQWLDVDHISQEVIMEALRRAVLQGKTTLNYIDRILLNWQKQNLKTVNQIMEKDRYPSPSTLKHNKKSGSSTKSPYNSIYNKIYK